MDRRAQSGRELARGYIHPVQRRPGVDPVRRKSDLRGSRSPWAEEGKVIAMGRSTAMPYVRQFGGSFWECRVH
jgi:hypothetical protein